MPNQVGTEPEFCCDSAEVRVYPTLQDLGAAAAAKAAQVINREVGRSGHARVIVATGNSQLPLVEALVTQDIPWQNVEIFHMDEYAGMSDNHPASFRLWIKSRIEDRVHPGRMNYLEGDAPDLDAEIERYTRLLKEAPIDLAFVGFGENGHIAFNDPHVADFNDPAMVKRVILDDLCRRQQAGEGHFPNPESVPGEAITITCSGLFRAKTWVCSVPEARKAEAVRNALEGQISEACPASLVRRHPAAYVYLDTDSASLLSRTAQKS